MATMRATNNKDPVTAKAMVMVFWEEAISADVGVDVGVGVGVDVGVGVGVDVGVGVGPFSVEVGSLGAGLGISTSSARGDSGKVEGAGIAWFPVGTGTTFRDSFTLSNSAALFSASCSLLLLVSSATAAMDGTRTLEPGGGRKVSGGTLCGVGERGKVGLDESGGRGGSGTGTGSGFGGGGTVAGMGAGAGAGMGIGGAGTGTGMGFGGAEAG